MMNVDFFVCIARRRICLANATWNTIGVTVAGQSNGSCSASLSDLNYPNDAFVVGNGTLYIADYSNNRIVRWYRNDVVGAIVAGTGAYGSWSTLLARPATVTSRCCSLAMRPSVLSLSSNSSRQSDVRVGCGKLSNPSEIRSMSFIQMPFCPLGFSLDYQHEFARRRDHHRSIRSRRWSQSDQYGWRSRCTALRSGFAISRRHEKPSDSRLERLESTDATGRWTNGFTRLGFVAIVQSVEHRTR